MQEKAKVVSIEKAHVSVIPVDIEACIGCSNSECKDNGHIFTVVNQRNLPIEVGSIVKITATMKNQIVQLLTAVLIPIACAITVFIYIPKFLPLISEGAQVGAALLAAGIGSVVVYRVKKIQTSEMPEIIEVL